MNKIIKDICSRFKMLINVIQEYTPRKPIVLAKFGEIFYFLLSILLSNVLDRKKRRKEKL